jgi:formylmethanofuran dehydrogenase subunit D
MPLGRATCISQAQATSQGIRKECVMIIETGLSRLELRRGDTVRLDDAHGATVSCAAGSIWVTRDNDPADLILGAGDKVRIDGPGLVVIQAFEASRVAVASNALSLARDARRAPVRARLEPVRTAPMPA